MIYGNKQAKIKGGVLQKPLKSKIMQKNTRAVLISILINLILTAFTVFSMLFAFENNYLQYKQKPIIVSQNKPEEVNIVFSTDKSYKKYLHVAILSAILNKKEDSYYNIYVLGIDLTKKENKEIENLVKFENSSLKDKRVKISVIPLKSSILDKKLKRKFNLHYVSRADFFKIFLPEIFRYFNKILYLDCDILVLGDLKDLYDTDLQDKYLGVVKRFDSSPKLKQDFYNCGVMLYNIKKWREDDISNKIADFKNKNNKNTTLTQYPFNKIIKKKDIILLSPLFNNIVWDEKDFDIEKYKKNYSPFADSIKDYKDLNKKTVIAHFAGIKKPWYNPEMEFGDKWQNYARLINPKWKKERRNLLKYTLNCYAITSKFTQNKNINDFLKNFYHVFKYNY